MTSSSLLFFWYLRLIAVSRKTVNCSWAEIRSFPFFGIRLSLSFPLVKHLNPLGSTGVLRGEKNPNTNGHTRMLMGRRTVQPWKRFCYLWILVCSWASLEDADMKRRIKKGPKVLLLKPIGPNVVNKTRKNQKKGEMSFVDSKHLQILHRLDWAVVRSGREGVVLCWGSL